MENKNIVYELKCKECGKVCGAITFPPDAKVDLGALAASHETHCEQHDGRPERVNETKE